MYDGCLWFLSKYFVCETEKNYNAPQLAVTASSPKYTTFHEKKSVSFFLCENPQPTLWLLFYVVMKKDEKIAL